MMNFSIKKQLPIQWLDTDLMVLLLLAAIWGSSFIFMRVASPVLGAPLVGALRVSIAAIPMVLYCRSRRLDIAFKQLWRLYFFIGITSAAIPSFVFSYAALYIPVAYSAVMNASSPLFAALIAWAWLHQTPSIRVFFALLLGMAGVAFMVGLGPIPLTMPVLLAVGGCAIGAICYGIASHASKKYASQINPIALTAGMYIACAITCTPFIIYNWPQAGHWGNASVWVSVILLAVVCSAAANTIYYHILQKIGPTRALTVTFLIPMFGIAWGYLLLGEALHWETIVGCVLVLFSTRSILKK
jgi:drug/metabolite transporter (DMT)-like permease